MRWPADDPGAGESSRIGALTRTLSDTAWSVDEAHAPAGTAVPGHAAVEVDAGHRGTDAEAEPVAAQARYAVDLLGDPPPGPWTSPERQWIEWFGDEIKAGDRPVRTAMTEQHEAVGARLATALRGHLLSCGGGLREKSKLTPSPGGVTR